MAKKRRSSKKSARKDKNKTSHKHRDSDNSIIWYIN